jgi:hypothetical protein
LLSRVLFCGIMNLRLHVLLDQPQHGALQTLAKRAGVSVSDLVRHAVDELIAKSEREQAIVLPLRGQQ